MAIDRYRLIAIGTSAGGLEVLVTLLRRLPKSFPVPIVIVQHLSRSRESNLSTILSNVLERSVVEIEDKTGFVPGGIYVAPSNYHVLVEESGYFSLSVEEEENYSRPSIDVLFESATEALGGEVIGIVLTGANQDGARGLASIAASGGFTMVQDLDQCEFTAMPAAALRAVTPDYVGSPYQLGDKLLEITGRGERYT